MHIIHIVLDSSIITTMIKWYCKRCGNEISTEDGTTIQYDKGFFYHKNCKKLTDEELKKNIESNKPIYSSDISL